MINDILFNKQSVVLRLMKLPKSSARSKLIAILKSSNDEIVTAVFNAYCRKHFGREFINCPIKVPASLLPECDDFFQWLTDSLKKSI